MTAKKQLRSVSDPAHRFISPDLDALLASLGEGGTRTHLVVEHVYFDTGHPSMFYTGFVRGRRVVDGPDVLFDPDAMFQLEHRPSALDPVHTHDTPLSLAEIPSVAGRRTKLDRLMPMFGVRFERVRHEVSGVRIDVDLDVTYFSLIGDEPMEVGREAIPRITARTAGKPKQDKRLEEALGAVTQSPYTAKKWMGFHFLKSCYELPRHDDLAGFEYELKLDVDSLDIDAGRLPFPILEVHQSDSLRRYYSDYRACVRGESAHTVEKGPVTSIGGILRRRESKKRGLDPWKLPPPRMVMHRYKREINVFNPDSGRVYTLSLHHCESDHVFQQLEIEYDGRVVPGAVGAMARFRLDHDPRHFLDMAARADAMSWGYLGDQLRERYLRFSTDRTEAEVVRASMTQHQLEPSDPPDPKVEAEVVDDMRLLRKALVRHGFRPSRQTKRKWLRTVYASRET